ncbi:hypothetical protein EDD17DRAFT_1540589 [Pisolithus thermaeus]|nr:hypothetical protein EV401DRAFT_2003107 [Pisolithus croceorrhizus]KAI6167389.1 hypothetical protein EDD17DRAFT_1540589 [Pisolithus thermaeus]
MLLLLWLLILLDVLVAVGPPKLTDVTPCYIKWHAYYAQAGVSRFLHASAKKTIKSIGLTWVSPLTSWSIQ